MKNDYELFRRTTPVGVRVFLYSVFAIVLMLVDGGQSRLHPIRSAVKLAVEPIQRGLNSTKQWFADTFNHAYSIQELASQNQQLIANQETQKAQMSLYLQLQKENEELRGQLQLQKNAGIPASVAADVLYQVVDPYSRRLVLNKGSNDGVVKGQPVITSEGLLGQVTDVTPITSEVTLVIDTRINVPVQVKRAANPVTATTAATGAPTTAGVVSATTSTATSGAATPVNNAATVTVPTVVTSASQEAASSTQVGDGTVIRALVSGDKREGYLAVRFFRSRVDVQVNDLLVTSGLDGLYPAGLPVGRVAAIDGQGDDDQTDEITVVPTAASLMARHVLILKVANVGQMRAHAAEQNNQANDSIIPTTLGAKRREQSTGAK